MVDRKRAIHIATAVGGGLAVAATLFGVLVLARGTDLFAGFSIATRYGWFIPLFSGLVILCVAWALSTHPTHGSHDRPVKSAVPCDRCGKTVMGDWRLCPYCGSMLTPVSGEGAQPRGSIV